MGDSSPPLLLEHLQTLEPENTQQSSRQADVFDLRVRLRKARKADEVIEAICAGQQVAIDESAGSH
jgi:hypothetical protein